MSDGSIDCDKVYSEYGGKSVSVAGTEGGFSALTSLVGAGGFWKPVDTQALTNIQQGYSDIQKAWNQQVQSYKDALNSEQQQFHQQQLTMIQELIDFHQEITDEEISKNTLFISITFSALIIIIIYLMIL